MGKTRLDGSSWSVKLRQSIRVVRPATGRRRKLGLATTRPFSGFGAFEAIGALRWANVDAVQAEEDFGEALRDWLAGAHQGKRLHLARACRRTRRAWTEGRLGAVRHQAHSQSPARPLVTRKHAAQYPTTGW